MVETPALEELARRLWDERRIVTYLLFKLTVTKLLLSADERRFLPEALAEVDRTVELLRDGEELRETALRELAGIWRMDPVDLTLAELARLAPAPYDYTFGEHLVAFQELAQEVDAVAKQNRALAQAELTHVTDTIGLLTGQPAPRPTTYDARGHLETAMPVGGHLREAL
jgi:hypothetical protein